jgi:hypothetical protein
MLENKCHETQLANYEQKPQEKKDGRGEGKYRDTKWRKKEK